MCLFDSILGDFNSSTGGFLTDRMISSAPCATAPNTEAVDLRLGEIGGHRSGIRAAALRLDPDRAKTALAAFAGGNTAQDAAINQALKARQILQKAAVIDEATGKDAQPDRDGTLTQARDAVKRDPGKRAAIIARLGQLGITV
jgi:hypothetical protein